MATKPRARKAREKAALAYLAANRSLIILHTLYQRWNIPTATLRLPKPRKKK